MSLNSETMTMANVVSEPEEKLRKIIVGSLLALLVVAGVAMRISGLDEYYFSSDDALHIAVARADTFGEFWNNVAHGDVHAPLHPFLVFLALKVSSNELFLRGISIVPGIILIYIFYLLGRERGGRPGGLTAAFVATFSFALISVSQTIRDYSWFLVSISASLFFFERYRSRGSLRDLIWYGTCASVALLFNYTAVFIIAGVGFVYGVRLLCEKKTKRFREWIIVNSALALIGTILFFALISIQWFGSNFHTDVVNEWLKTGFPSGIGWYENSLGFLFYFTSPLSFLAASLFAWLIGSGTVLLWRQRSFDTALLPFFIVAIGVVMSQAGWYPFIPSRHGLFLLPAFIVPLSVGGMFFYRKVAALLRAWGNARSAIIFFCGIFLAVSFYAYAFIRDIAMYRPLDYSEFPVTDADFASFKAALEERTKPEDIILIETTLFHYMAMEQGGLLKAPYVAPGIQKTVYRNRTFYHVPFPQFLFSSWEKFETFARRMDPIILSSGRERVWLATLGWKQWDGYSGSLFNALADQPEPDKTRDKPDRRDPLASAARVRDELLQRGAIHDVLISGGPNGGTTMFAVDWKKFRSIMLMYHEANY